MTRDVCTMWYRAPEVLFGTNHYSAPIDLWSVGCIFAELAIGAPMFPGENAFDQAAKVFNTLGTPGEEEWEGM
jgi:serine/threonine protein kinase